MEIPMPRWFFVVLLGTLTAATAHATDLTVSPGQSITAALRQMHAGDTLTIEEGTYDEQELHPPSGVTVQGAAGHTVVIRPTGHPTTGFEFGSSQITIRNLTIDGSAGGVSTGMFITGSDN